MKSIGLDNITVNLCVSDGIIPEMCLDTLFVPTKIQDIVLNVLDFLQQSNIILAEPLQSYVFSKPVELDIYIAEAQEARAINLEARGKDYATNILSYPCELPTDVIEMMSTLPLGELVICPDVVIKEAMQQQKAVAHHLTHLYVHGILHLLGFDHEISEQDAEEMESLEIAILAKLGIANPYEI